MSFASLRAARKSKQLKSYVNISMPVVDANVTSEDAAASVTDEIGQGEGKHEQGMNTASPVAISTAEYTDLFAALSVSLAVHVSHDKGRGIFTKESFRPGAQLLSLRPHAFALSTPFMDFRCSRCAAPAPPLSGLKRCTTCRTVRYCDAVCQKNDWSVHKHECPALNNWASAAPSQEVAVPSDAVRCLGRILWMKRAKGLDSIWSREFDALQSHREGIHPTSHEKFTLLAHSLVRYLGLSSPAELAAFDIPSSEALVNLISRFTSNSFALTSPSLTPIGVAVSPPAGLLNHSCVPNAVVVFPNSSRDPSKQEPCLQVIALRHISVDEEVYISYVDTTLSRSLRQRTLEETYNFTCRCGLCAEQSGIDLRNALFCPKSCGGMCLAPAQEDDVIRCTKCRALVTETGPVLDALRLGQEALDKATSLQNRDPVQAKHITTNMLPILSSAGLVPSAHPMLAMSRLHQYLLISSLGESPTQASLDEVVRIAAKVSVGLTSLLAPGHPVPAVQLAEQGKLLAVDEPAPDLARPPHEYPPSGPARLKHALETLIRAREQLALGFGVVNEGGFVAKQVRESIVFLEKEIRIWNQGVRNVAEDARGLMGKT